nr:hypothetical protein [Gammaproteobacteria bacterium]
MITIPMPMKVPQKKTLCLYLIIVIFAVLTLEGLSWLALKQVFLPRGYVYKPKLIQTLSSYAKYQAYGVASWGIGSDPVAQRSSGPGDTQPLAEPAYSSICVSLYGDSFTADLRWGEWVAGMLGCDVANYGVPGFGIDQALMRFEDTAHDTAGTVVLSFFSEDIARHVTRNFDVWVYQPSDFGASVFASKARYIALPDGRLQYVPAETRTFVEFEAAVRDPAAHVPHDYLVVGGMSGLPIWRFPFTLTLVRIFFHWKVQAKLAQLPWYGQLYMPDHESRALPISVQIVDRFVAVAQARGKRSVVQLLPSILDFQYYARKGVWPYQSLIDALATRNVRMHNLGDELLKDIDLNEACALFDTGQSSGIESCGGHYSELGYRILARHTAAQVEAL